MHVSPHFTTKTTLLHSPLIAAVLGHAATQSKQHTAQSVSSTLLRCKAERGLHGMRATFYLRGCSASTARTSNINRFIQDVSLQRVAPGGL